ncbi:IS200/IS605 family transposase [Patescibacteria group bacterium]|nr:IS200/IS605 family transposase [Patescibacteria group bacterium]
MNERSTKTCYAVSMRIRQLNHSVYQLQYHLVWGTKYRRKFLAHYVRTELIKSLYKVLKRHPDWYLHNVNTGSDHVHLLIEIPPIFAIAAVARELKLAMIFVNVLNLLIRYIPTAASGALATLYLVLVLTRNRFGGISIVRITMIAE